MAKSLARDLTGTSSIDFGLTVRIDGLRGRYAWTLLMADQPIHATSFDFTSFAEAEDAAKACVVMAFAKLMRQATTPTIWR